MISISIFYKIKTNNFLLKFVCILVLNYLFLIDFAQSSQFSPAIKVNNVFISKYDFLKIQELN